MDVFMTTKLADKEGKKYSCPRPDICQTPQLQVLPKPPSLGFNE